jgi:glutaminyl-peptide cyclotransferase
MNNFREFIESTSQENHTAKKTSVGARARLANLKDLTHFDDVIDNILVERVVGTPGHEKVRKFIVNSMEALNWDVELDEFEDQTPMGMKSFSNIIATLNPNAERYLVIACHYDSKYFKEGVFLGATGERVVDLVNSRN